MNALIENLSLYFAVFKRIRLACWLARRVTDPKYQATMILAGGEPCQLLWYEAMESLLSEVLYDDNCRRLE